MKVSPYERQVRVEELRQLREENTILKEERDRVTDKYLEIAEELKRSLTKAAAWEQAAKVYQEAAMKYEEIRQRECCRKCKQWLKFEDRHDGMCKHPARVPEIVNGSDNCALWEEK